MSKTLPAFEAAFNSAGRSKADIARRAGITTETLRNWMEGARLVPVHKRELLQEAFGRAIDWPQACAQCNALTKPTEAPAPAKLIKPAGIARPPIAKMPAAAPKHPAKAPQAATATPPTPKPAARPQRLLFGLIPVIDDSGEE